MKQRKSKSDDNPYIYLKDKRDSWLPYRRLRLHKETQQLEVLYPKRVYSTEGRWRLFAGGTNRLGRDTYFIGHLFTEITKEEIAIWLLGGK